MQVYKLHSMLLTHRGLTTTSLMVLQTGLE